MLATMWQILCCVITTYQMVSASLTEILQTWLILGKTAKIWCLAAPKNTSHHWYFFFPDPCRCFLPLQLQLKDSRPYCRLCVSCYNNTQLVQDLCHVCSVLRQRGPHV